MLVLTRKSQEAVAVGGSVGFKHTLKVTVLEIDGGKVRLSFEIDREVPVHRWEIWERIHSNGRTEYPQEDSGSLGASPSIEKVLTDPVGNMPGQPAF